MQVSRQSTAAAAMCHTQPTASAAVFQQRPRQTEGQQAELASISQQGQRAHQIFTPVSKRPEGVSMTKAGGLKGYSAGIRMRPW